MSGVRVRFAPSPTGSLHVGSARTALYNFLYARHCGGAMVLRIEDTDLKRSQSTHDASILSDLAWLGLRADEGPDVGGDFGPYRQSQRAHLYEEAVQRLLADGWAYPCFCPQELLDERKEEQLARGEMPVYDRTCLDLSAADIESRFAAGEKAAIRFRVPEGDVTFEDLIHGSITFSSDVIGDFIIKRTDGGYSYNFAVVVDDAGMEITHVIRGEDHVTNTARQMMLFSALSRPAPRYGHHSLILAPDGSKLSKRHGATSIGDFRALGYLPAAMVNYLALLSWHPADERDKFSLAELIAEFDIERVSKSPAIFDVQKLNWLNGLYIRELETSELYGLVEPYLAKAGLTLAPVQRDVITEAVQSKLAVLGDAPRYVAAFIEEADLGACACSEGLLTPGSRALFELARAVFLTMPGEYLPVAEAQQLLRSLVEKAKEQGIKGKAVYHPLRIALSARDEGPELFYLVGGLGRSTILGRLDAAAEYVARHKETGSP
ncbi:MAG: glutamate--tRNA ligase [Thermoleophilia bacterium]|nr:glutamate--tRNA ligase [Thermoleophilia bacterium]